MMRRRPKYLVQWESEQTDKRAPLIWRMYMARRYPFVQMPPIEL